MKTEADRIYKDLRTNTYHSESEEDKAAASGTMWTLLKKTWKKGKDGTWVKKSKK
jgi:cation transport regulator ChaB